jgi:hypothetical protein
VGVVVGIDAVDGLAELVRDGGHFGAPGNDGGVLGSTCSVSTDAGGDVLRNAHSVGADDDVGGVDLEEIDAIECSSEVARVYWVDGARAGKSPCAATTIRRASPAEWSVRGPKDTPSPRCPPSGIP